MVSRRVNRSGFRNRQYSPVASCVGRQPAWDWDREDALEHIFISQEPDGKPVRVAQAMRGLTMSSHAQSDGKQKWCITAAGKAWKEPDKLTPGMLEANKAVDHRDR